MGAWAKVHYGREKIGKTGIMLAGTGTSEIEKRILSNFDEIQFSKDNVYHTYLEIRLTLLSLIFWEHQQLWIALVFCTRAAVEILFLLVMLMVVSRILR
jgi:hypothetical protein